MKGAGTDAQVFLQVYGETGKSDQMKLESKSDSLNRDSATSSLYVCVCFYLVSHKNVQWSQNIFVYLSVNLSMSLH